MTIIKKHGISLLLLLALLGLYVMCFAIPIFTVFALFGIVPISAYLMHRYTPFAPPVIAVIFALISFFVNRSNVYLYFIPPAILGQLGLFYALRNAVFWKGILIASICVCIGLLSATFLSMIFAGQKDFPKIVNNEIRSNQSPTITHYAKLYYDATFSDEDKLVFRLPEGESVPDDIEEELYYALYSYGNYIERMLRTELLGLLFGYSILLGGGAYLIACVLLRGNDQPNLPTKPPLKEMRIPAGYWKLSLPIVMIMFLLTYVWEWIYPVHLAVYHAMVIAPFALVGVCFFVFLASILPKPALQYIGYAVIIALLLVCILSDIMVFVFAIAGMADYLVNFRKLILRLFSDE